jgi:biopolymer transport protein ExbD
MAEVQTDTLSNKKSAERFNKKSMKVDLTPMVDLGFLLITFFILTTSLVEPTITKLAMPKDDKITTTPVCESCTLTLLPRGNNEILYYEGIPSLSTIMHKTTYATINGLRELILDKQQKVMKVRGSKDEMVVIIKPGKEASYKNTMDILDEMTINNVTKYYLDDEDEIDKKLTGDN